MTAPRRGGQGGTMDQDDQDKPKLVDELARMEREPLLPIEKKLIVISLALGVGLLALLAGLRGCFPS
jgi:hypothetical protein